MPTGSLQRLRATGTLVDLLRWRAGGQGGNQPDRVGWRFLADGEREAGCFSYAELDARAQAIAGWLQSQFPAGERVLVTCPSGLDYVAAFFGCLYARMVAVPVPLPDSLAPRLRGRLPAILSSAGARGALTTSSDLPQVDDLVAKFPEAGTLQWFAADQVDQQAWQPRWRPPSIRAEDLAFLQYTSGSTAQPKGVMVSHANLMHNCGLMHDAWSMTEDDHIIGWLPLFHDMGLIGNLLLALYAGVPVTFMPPTAFVRAPVRWLRAVTRYRGTVSMAPNFAYDLCAQKVQPEQRDELDLSTWRLAVNGAEPVRTATLRRFTESFADCGWRGEAMSPAYGLAEATLYVSAGAGHRAPAPVRFAQGGLREDRAEATSDPAVPGRALVSCSVPPAGQRLAIVDPVSRAELPEGRIGEIWLAGPSVAKGYWSLAEETGAIFGASLADGDGTAFLRTGDLGFRYDGELYITGRSKDLMIIRGENYYPQDVELAAERSCPLLRPNGSAAFTLDVADEECAVLVAEVRRNFEDKQLPEALESIRAGVLEETMLHLDAVVLMRPGRIAKTSSGKIQRHAVRDAFLAGKLPALVADVPAWMSGPAAAEPASQVAGQTGEHPPAALAMGTRPEGGAAARPMQFSLLYFSSNEAGFTENKYRLLLEGAKFADEHGFTAVWLPERHFHAFGGLYPNPSVLAAALAMATKRIRLRAGSVVLPMHHPVRVAEEWAVVDNLSGGRVDLAFAAGWNPNDFALAPDNYATRYELLYSGMDTVRTLWSGGTVELRNGTGAQVPVRVFPEPQQPSLNAWLTCSGSVERFIEAGERGVNVLTGLLFQNTEELAGKIAAYREARGRSGHDPDAGHVTLMLHTFIGDDLDEVKETVRGPFISYLESSVDLWRHGVERLSEMSPSEREQVLSYAFERYFQSAALIGTPRSCLPFVQRLQVAGVNEIACLIDFGVDVDTTIEGLDSLNVLRKRAQRQPLAASPPVISGVPTADPGQQEPLSGAGPVTGLSAGGSPDTSSAEIFHKVLAAGSAARLDLLQEYMRGRVAEALGRTVEEISWAHTVRGLGLDSLMVVSAMNACQRDLRIVLAPGDFYRLADFDSLAGYLARTFEQAHVSNVAGASRLSGLRRRARKETFPLSFPQQRLWFLEQLTPGTVAYCTPMAVRLSGPLDLAALRQGLNFVVARHEALRTAFVDQAAEPCQVVTAQQQVPVTLTDLSGRPAETRESIVMGLATKFARYPFDLAESPLLRATVFRLATDDHLLVMTGHHIVIDGWAIKVLFDELAVGYRAACSGEKPVLPELPLQYPDFTLWQREVSQGPVVAEQLEYWKKQLAGAPALLELPTDRPRPAVQRFRGRTMSVTLPTGLSAALRRLSQAEGVTLFMTLLAAFSVLLARYSGQDEVVVGTPVANRTRPELEGLIGFFANTLALRTRLDGNPGFRELVDRVRRTCLDAYSHQDAPFELVIDALRPSRDLSHQLVFQAVFALQSTALPDMDFPGLKSSPVELDPGTSRFDLAFSLSEVPEGLHCAVEYNTDLFDDATIEGMVEHYRALLESVVADPSSPIDRLDLRTEAERARLTEWNDTDLDYAPERSLHRLFEARAARVPDAIAVICGQRQLRYGALNERANRLAHLLRDRGVKPEVPVGVFVERSVESIVGLLAVLKAGGAYVPLDPAYPPERLDYMLTDSGVAVLLTRADLVERLLTRPPAIICFDRDAQDIALGRPDDIAGVIHPDQLAYLIYTSGSTGRPKGAMMAHRGLANLAVVEAGALDPEHGSRVLQLASLSFDASLWDIAMSLPFGGTLYIATAEQRLPGDELARLMTEQAITHATLPPSALAVLPPDCAPSLRVLTATGEALSAEVADRWAAGRRLINGYGPTETTVGATIGDCLGGGQRPDLGRPFANTQVHVLDRWLRPVAHGVPGEICVGGAGLSRGYAGRPGLTAERFVPDPSGHRPGARLYRTGDRGRFLADGRLVFQGRFDQQVQLRGFRIELGEIEAALREHPAVHEASVLVQHDDAGAARLLAYVAAEPGTTAAQLRVHCADRLPGYMLPRAFTVLEKLPRTPNGKLDRSALPDPDIDHRDPGLPYSPPRPGDEQTLASIWAQLLGVARVGRDDNFFALGGDSILSLKMVTHAVQAGLPLTTKLVFRHGTVAELATAVRPDAAAVPVAAVAAPVARATWELDVAEVARLTRQVSDLEDAYPPSPTQQGMLFHSLYAPESAIYRVQLNVRLDGPLDARALRAAWTRIVARHAVLRTTFHRTSTDRLVQVVRGTVNPQWTELDWRGEAEPEPAERLALLGAQERARPFDLSAAPPIRISLVRVADEVHQLVLTMHHALLDGWSLPIVLAELLAQYDATGAGGAELPPVRPYREFVAWLAQQDSSAAEEAWRAALDGVTAPTALPWDPPAVAQSGVASVVAEVPADVCARLRELCRRQGVTAGTVVQAAWAVLLARHAGQRDVVFGVTVSGRSMELPGVESMVGLFINTLPARVRVDDEARVGGWLRTLQSTLADLRELEHTPLTRIQGWSQVPRGTALFESLVVVENHPLGKLNTDASPVTVREVRVADETEHLLTLVAVPGERLQLRLLFQTQRYDRAGGRRLLDQLTAILDGFAGNEDQALGRLLLPDPPDGPQGAEVAEPAGHLYADAPAPITAFARQVAARPDAIAVVQGPRQFSYRALEERASELGRRLRAQGAGAETLCALLLERSPEQAAAILAVHLAGGACLPIDPDCPAERLAYLLTDSRCTVLVTTRELLERVPEQALNGLEVLLIGAGPPAAPPAADESTAEARDVAVPAPRQLAYAIYPSGPTGRPQGVLVEHAQVARLSAAVKEQFRFDHADVWTLCQSPASGFSVGELWGALTHGARLVIVDDNTRHTPAGMARLLAEQAVTVCHQTPSDFLPLAAAITDGDTCPTRLRAIVLGGEALATDRLADFAGRMGPTGPALINMYGITETTVQVTYHVVTDADLAPGSPSVIGCPLPGLDVHILDGGRPAAPGLPGEMHVGGAGLARGYLGRAGLTADHFRPDPFTATPGSRLYRTGDRARVRHDGALIYLGRTDHQIKLHGTQALPAPGSGRGHSGIRPEAPANTIETQLAELCTDILGSSPIGRSDNFFVLGGDSLSAVVLQSRIRSVFGAELALRDLFGAPDLEALAGQIAERLPASAVEQPQIPRLAAGRPWLPLSFGQQRLLFLEQWEPGTPLYHVSGALLLDGELNVAALRRGVQDLVDRHESLRTELFDDGGEWRQRVLGGAPVHLPLIDVSGLPADERAAQAELLVRSVAETVFDLDGGPVWRLVLVRLSFDQHRLGICLHHLIADGQSLAVLIRELGESYTAFHAGEALSRTPLPLQYGDYVLWQHDLFQRGRPVRELEYWRGRLAGLADVTLPAELPRPPVQTLESAVHTAEVPVAVVHRLSSLSRNTNSTLFMTLFAASAVALAQVCGVDEAVVGTPVANRSRPELEVMIGYLANTVVLRLAVTGCVTFTDLLAHARTACLEAYEHAEIPFEMVVQELRPDRNASHLPLFQTWFVVQEELPAAAAFDGLDVEPVAVTPQLARYDLRLEFRRSAVGMHLICEYKTSLFTTAGIERLSRHLTTVLAEVAADPELRLDRLAERLRVAEHERRAEAAQSAAAYSAAALDRSRRGDRRIRRS